MVWNYGSKIHRQGVPALAVAFFVLCTVSFVSSIKAQSPSVQSPPKQSQFGPVNKAASRELAPARPDLPAEGQQTFASAKAAVEALVAALEKNDNHALATMLGPDAEKLLSSGDTAEDERNRQKFLDKYKEMHRLLTEQNGLTTLYVGAENWPAPIPLARRGHLWYFDTPAGEKEVLYRRIGQNELTVIGICGEMVKAEKEYYAQPHDGSSQRQFAAKLLSSPGEQNGLYWETAAGAPQSPLGPLLAAAEGFPQGASPRRTPLYGYYFRILKNQGPNAPGGAKSYVSDGMMTGGFAFIAYPAEYRSSGVMTFQVGSDGVVYQKDMGPHTDQVAPSITAFNPDHGWANAK